jgi:predicted dinucleotide-binding enzyme
MSQEQDELVDLKVELEKSNSDAEVDALSCAKEASWEADIIIMATPYEAEKIVADKIQEVATGKIVISISNPLNNAYMDSVTSPDTSAAEELQKLLPHSKVVKTFNTIFAADFNAPPIDRKTVDVFITGNSGEAVEVVSEVVKAVGFNPIIVGDLAVSRTLERMHLHLVQLTMKYNYNWLAGWKTPHKCQRK